MVQHLKESAESLGGGYWVFQVLNSQFSISFQVIY